jgi:hypothetical protein
MAGSKDRPSTDLFEEHIMKTTLKIIAGTITVLSLATAGAVFAHPGMGMGPGYGMGMGPGSGMGMGPGYGMGMGMGPGHGMGMRGAMAGPEAAAWMTGRLAELKTELKITPTQDAAWQAYTTVVQQQAAAGQALRAQMLAQTPAPGTATPADRSAQFEAMGKLREQHLAARDAALKDLYAVLSPEQKQLADQRLNRMPGHRMAWRAPAK